jgi:hypothetical protein
MCCLSSLTSARLVRPTVLFLGKPDRYWASHNPAASDEPAEYVRHRLPRIEQALEDLEPYWPVGLV